MTEIIGYVLPNGVEIVGVITKDGKLYQGIEAIKPLFETATPVNKE